MDATSMHARQSVVERMRARGGTVVPSGIHQQPLQSLKQSGFLKVMGRENVCATFDDALVQVRKVLESEKGPSR